MGELIELDRARLRAILTMYGEQIERVKRSLATIDQNFVVHRLEADRMHEIFIMLQEELKALDGN